MSSGKPGPCVRWTAQATCSVDHATALFALVASQDFLDLTLVASTCVILSADALSGLRSSSLNPPRMCGYDDLRTPGGSV